MAGLEKVGTGQRFRPKAETWNSFIDVANYVRQRMMNQQSSPDRLQEDATPFKNMAASAVPMFGIGWLTDAAFQGLAVVKQPGYPGISRIVIASKPCEAGGVGAGWTEGLRPVRVTNWAGISVGDRIGAQMNSWDAGLDPLGPMIVIGKLGSPLVVALITGQRGDHKMCYCGETGPSGPYQVILFGPGHTVIEDSPGNLTVRRVT